MSLSRERIIVLDTETTGISRSDRIVTLAAIRFEGSEMREYLHRIYNPTVPNNPRAFAVHGWSDDVLRHQDLFSDEAGNIRHWLAWADRLVIHNASFDMRFLNQEMAHAGLPGIGIPVHCTMRAARTLWPSQTARLDACLERIGLSRQSHLHGALEDALLAANLHFFLEGRDCMHTMDSALFQPTNLKPAPLPFRQEVTGTDASEW